MNVLTIESIFPVGELFPQAIDGRHATFPFRRLKGQSPIYNSRAPQNFPQKPLNVTFPIAFPLSTSAWAFFKFSALMGLKVCV